MKKVYIPTEEELYKIEHLTRSGLSTYRYILAKAIEALIMEKKLDPKKNILELAYKYFGEFPDIIYAICKMYPMEKLGNEEAESDTELCIRLIKSIKKEDDSIKQLDDLLEYFENGLLVLDNYNVINTVVNTLADGLQAYPKYRYEYKQNKLLDQILSCEIPSYSIPIQPTESFITIDPIYSLKIPSFNRIVEHRKENIVRESIDIFAMRNGVDLYSNSEIIQDVMNNPDPKTKKLLRCLEHHKRNYQ